MKLLFEKYQANGNDYILVDSSNINEKLNYSLKQELSIAWCIRHYSVGADDVIFLEQSDVADIKITIIEPDGSEADMCGNGIRCVAAYLSEKLNKANLKIETLAGIKDVNIENELYSVNMGKMNMNPGFFAKRYLSFMPPDSLYNLELNYPEIGSHIGSIIYSGEPNIVFIKEEIKEIDIERWGQNISLNKKLFPIGICTVLVEPLSSEVIKARFFEKGVYRETNACGTGATAAAYIAKNVLNLTSKRITVNMKGGNVYVEPGFENQDTLLIGEAKWVFSGHITV